MSASMSFEPGARVENGIPLCVPEIRGNEWDYMKECLDTGWVSSVGSYVTKFENAIAERSQNKHAVATNNGTAAIHLALMCAGVQHDDEVITSTLTFIAPANAIRYIGAHPVFVDAEPVTWQMDAAVLAAFLSEKCERTADGLRNRTTGRRVAALMPVDVLGTPVDFDAIEALAKEYGLPIVEDVTESLGARYKGMHVGARALASCFSFNGNKLITTGGGGMIATQDDTLAKRARYLSTQAKDDPVEYVHGSVGFNYRLTNIQGAMGVAQMELLDDYIDRKRANASRYRELLGDVPGLTMMTEPSYAYSTYWLYTILVDEARFGMSSRDLLKALGAKNIQARPLWQPMHRSPAHAGCEVVGGAVADQLCRDALSIPSSVGLRANELEVVAQSIIDAHRSR